MPFHSDIMSKVQGADYASVAIQMAISFAFWFVVSFFTGGSRWAAGTLGAAISGIMAIVNGGPAGTLPGKFGIVTSAGYTKPRGSPGWNLTGMAMSVGVTFVVWLVAGYFFIKGSAWKYATTAAVLAAISSFLN
jgi:hypothetical protein